MFSEGVVVPSKRVEVIPKISEHMSHLLQMIAFDGHISKRSFIASDSANAVNRYPGSGQDMQPTSELILEAATRRQTSKSRDV